MDDQRDYAEEAYNRRSRIEEGISESDGNPDIPALFNMKLALYATPAFMAFVEDHPELVDTAVKFIYAMYSMCSLGDGEFGQFAENYFDVFKNLTSDVWYVVIMAYHTK